MSPHLAAPLASRTAASLLICALTSAYWATGDSGRVEVTSATTIAVTDLLGEPASAGPPVLAPVVSTRHLSNGQSLVCALRRRCEPLRPVDDVDASAGVVSSAQDAATAVRLVTGGACAPTPPSTSPTGVRGPSAGLAFAVYWLDQCTDGSVLAGRTAAATGYVHPDGRVLPVTATAAKTRAAARSGVDVVLIPSGSPAEVSTRPGAARVIDVATLTAAIDSLGGALADPAGAQ